MTDRDPKLDSIERFFEAYGEDDREAIASVLAEGISWSIPGHHPLAGTKHGIDEVMSFFDQLAEVGFKADTVFLEASDEYVVDIHRGYSTQGHGSVDTTWALIWHFDGEGKVDEVTNLSGDQHGMDAFVWRNFQLARLPTRLAG
ncbi:hypothetical protein BH20ACT19_BH20ACT19_00290 [soil metagenome]